MPNYNISIATLEKDNVGALDVLLREAETLCKTKNHVDSNFLVHKLDGSVLTCSCNNCVTKRKSWWYRLYRWSVDDYGEVVRSVSKSGSKF